MTLTFDLEVKVMQYDVIKITSSIDFYSKHIFSLKCFFYMYVQHILNDIFLVVYATFIKSNFYMNMQHILNYIFICICNIY